MPYVNFEVHVSVLHKGRVVFATPLDRPLCLGRQLKDEPPPYSRCPSSDCDRVVIATAKENTISRRHIILTQTPEGQLTVRNASKVQKLEVNGKGLLPGESQSLQLPSRIVVASLELRIKEGEASLHDYEVVQSLEQRQDLQLSVTLRQALSVSGPTVESNELLAWMRKAMTVFQSAATSADFLELAAQSAADLVGLDQVVALLRSNGEWVIAATASRSGQTISPEWEPSHSILARMCQEKQTIRQLPPTLSVQPISLIGVTGLVSAPILDGRGEVIGALYGDRRSSDFLESCEISSAEATFVDLLASSAAAGLARLEEQQAAVAARVQFEQFFTPALAQQLEQQPTLLDGRDVEVTILFVDIHGFSRISERMGPAGSLGWVRDFMGTMSDCIIEHEGVLVDYIGDEIMAMWGAPVTSSNHAARACAAALDMTRRSPALSERWQAKLGEPTEIGIGIDTGLAHVGNTGSPRKFKYGPLGRTVNQASRVQGASSYFRSRILISGATRAGLGDEFHVRRLRRVRVVNIEEPVELYELVLEPTPAWFDLREKYETALEAFETADFQSATRVLGNLTAQYPDDANTLQLLAHTVDAMAAPSGTFDPVFRMPSK
ncbi:MAG: adenylate/guanylate cyclase domain-containing protein [Planctomycetota bacterium]|nr:MAG: adenylate/guanylate cyclase domain-containing protein [Planctomycetota bacterium]REK18112.1 MAG: adenylate/guanylate cyclase domain-containing protein [Planctomycetota bacterium]REK44219.1 MAG: adenylate/guanylate cyclase domain-containing protein [Planctomycetota bacterium]